MSITFMLQACLGQHACTHVSASNMQTTGLIGMGATSYQAAGSRLWRNKGAGATTLALIAPALQPLHRTAWAHEHRSHAYKNTSILTPRFTFALRLTRASNQNISKFTKQSSCVQRMSVYFMQIATEMMSLQINCCLARNFTRFFRVLHDFLQSLHDFLWRIVTSI